MKESTSKVIIFLLYFILVFYTFLCDKDGNFSIGSFFNSEPLSEFRSGLSNDKSSSCGPGDASCESNVRNHINGINGVELNFISYIQNNDGSASGKFRIGVLKQDEKGINQFSATITTDCNCNVIDAGGIVSH